MKQLLLLFVALYCVATSCSALMCPEDTIGLSTWKSWSEKEKTVFMFGFRLGSGSPVHTAPATTDKRLILNQEDFPKLLKRVDFLFADKANEKLTIRAAIEIALMELRGASKKLVAQMLESERTRYAWGF